MVETLRLNPSAASFTAVFNGRKQRSQSGYVKNISFTGGYWRLSISLPNMNRLKHDALIAFFDNLRGFDSFDLILEKYSTTKSPYRGTVLINGASQTGSSIDVDNLTPSTLILKAGDFIKFDSQEKVYRVTADVTSSGAGEATIPITPNIITSPSDSTAVTFIDVPFRVVTASEIGLDVDTSLRAGFDLEFEEAFTA